MAWSLKRTCFQNHETVVASSLKIHESVMRQTHSCRLMLTGVAKVCLGLLMALAIFILVTLRFHTELLREHAYLDRLVNGT